MVELNGAASEIIRDYLAKVDDRFYEKLQYYFGFKVRTTAFRRIERSVDRVVSFNLLTIKGELDDN
jgi:hypothetical protein